MHPQQFLVIALSAILVIIDCFLQTQKTKLTLILMLVRQLSLLFQDIILHKTLITVKQ